MGVRGGAWVEGRGKGGSVPWLGCLQNNSWRYEAPCDHVLLVPPGWLLGEHAEWTKHTNFDLAVRIPLLFYVPGVTSPRLPPGETFPFQDALKTGPSAPTTTADRKPSPLATNALVEAVDIYPTLAELAGVGVPPTCPPDPFKVAFCTEGASFAPLIHNVSRLPPSLVSGTWKKAVFSQYPRPSFEPSKRTISPSLNQTRIMGYSMRTVDGLRYTEWVTYDPASFSSNWSHVHARELYDYGADPEGNFNLVQVPAYGTVVKRLAGQLRAGWRKALPGYT